MPSAALHADDEVVTIHIPLTVRKRGGRKFIVAPEGEPNLAPRPREIDNTLVKALGRAFRWKRMLECGDYATIAEIAEAEKMHNSYVSRILNLTLLAPDIVEALLDGRQSAGFKLAEFTVAAPDCWLAQRRKFYGTTPICGP